MSRETFDVDETGLKKPRDRKNSAKEGGVERLDLRKIEMSS